MARDIKETKFEGQAAIEIKSNEKELITPLINSKRCKSERLINEKQKIVAKRRS